MNWYLAVLKKYAVFAGRARRKEYWMFFLFNFIITLALNGLAAIDGGILYNLYGFAIIIPAIAVGVRRMHDVGKSGWFYLIPIYSLILAATEGDKSDNQFGSDPKKEV